MRPSLYRWLPNPGCCRWYHVLLLVCTAQVEPFDEPEFPRMTMQTATGPVTVMVLAREHSRSKVRFEDHGYRGVIVPVAGHGSIAVLERGPAAGIGDVEEVAARVVNALDWES